jgi:hypothetical protein
MRGRVKRHNHKGKFDSVKYFEFPKDQISSEEQRFIDELNPILNRRQAVLTTVSRTTLYFTQEDKKVIDELKRDMETTYGALTTTALIRMALRKLNEVK